MLMYDVPEKIMLMYDVPEKMMLIYDACIPGYIKSDFIKF
jgi:hypothetical protein